MKENVHHWPLTDKKMFKKQVSTRLFFFLVYEIINKEINSKDFIIRFSMLTYHF